MHLAGRSCTCEGPVAEGPKVDRAVLESISSGVLFVDEGGGVAYANLAAEELIGQPLEGQLIGEILPGASLESDSRQRMLRLQRGSEDVLIGYRGVACVLEGLPGTVISFRDVTETERLRQDMERMRRLSELGRMCAVVAHEVRNPLAGIKATLDSIADEASGAGLQQPMSIIQHEVDRLGELLTSFLSYVRHRSARRRMQRVGDVVERALHATRQHTAGRCVEVDCSVAHPVCFDEAQIEQLLINLLINAGQATPEGGKITVGAELSAENLLRLSVEDTGSGIAEVDLPRIFDAFYTTRSTGTGLGLAICKKVATEHGGTLAVQNSAGGGARLDVQFPAGPAMCNEDTTESGADPDG